MQSWFTFELDGEAHRIEDQSGRETLAQFLAALDPLYSRYSEGNPWFGGAPVIMAETSGPAPRFRSVDAHLLLLPMLANAQIWTPEGIASIDPAHPAVRALGLEQMECGEARRMTILSLLFEGYYRPDMRRRAQLSEQFDAIVSRTADVPAIREAGARLFATAETMRHTAGQKSAPEKKNEVWTGRRDIFRDTFSRALYLKKPVETLEYVDRRKRRFFRPRTMVDLKRLQSQFPDSRLIAGGTGLISPLRGGEDFETLISLEAVDEMQMIFDDHEHWEIGAGVNLTRVAETIGGEYPSFLKALSRFASRPVRNRATLGGYLATASDSGQLAPLLMAMDARVQLYSADGERDASVSHFFEGQGKTILRPGETIRSILIPRGNEAALARRGMTSRLGDVYTVGPRRSLCEPFITGAFAVELREHIIAKAWIAYSGVSDRPVRARQTEDILAGRVWNREAIHAALAPLYREIFITRPHSGRANSDYRKQLVITLIQKFFFQHPTAVSIRPIDLDAESEFGRHDQPFFDSLT